ncbi:MAG: GIY-YIG nuclease family protein [Chakrabartia godavariana]
MAFWVYILRCSDGRYYTGQTDDLDRRIAEHQSGGFSDFTSRRRPVSLMWQENFQTRDEALAAEARIKPWSRAKKEALIAGDWAGVSFYARPPKERHLLAPFVSSEVETPDARSLDFARDERDVDLPTHNPSRLREGGMNV